MTLLPAPVETETTPPAEYGEVFTRRWVVELILDLCGYTPERDLAKVQAVEPSCGTGAFLVPMVERLARSTAIHGRDLSSADTAIRARDLLSSNVAKAQAEVLKALRASGLTPNKARALTEHWIQSGDFLLDPVEQKSADLVVGNPPYIRLEAVPPKVSAAYRQSCPTMGGRSDVYVGFYERGLSALRDGGVLAFICADRWMRNAYGANLRELISREWTVDAIVAMTGVDAFEQEVDAYPAITIIRRGPQANGTLVVDAAPDFAEEDARELVETAKGSPSKCNRGRFKANRVPRWFTGRAGWPHGSPDQLATIVGIEERLPLLEDDATETKVGIGVATGADRIFITADSDLVEQERLLPLAMNRDLKDGHLAWSGSFLVNPWDEQGLVDLNRWPRLNDYLQQHKSVLGKRHTAKRGKWHKTIDRVVPGLAETWKLYLPDFKETLFPVIDRGETYPHHNLYWITSNQWDLEILGGILMSDFANMFISAYSVRMRGGYLRFQAQYLRRIRLPAINMIDAATTKTLRRAFRERDRETATKAVFPLYGLDTPA